MSISTAHRPSLATAVLAAALFANAARAAEDDQSDRSGFTGFSVVELSEELGAPDGLATYRIIAHFGDPSIRVVGAGAGSGVREHFVVVTSDPEGLRNFGGILSGSDLEDFPGMPYSDPWDSWVTIDDVEFYPQLVRFYAGFLGGVYPAIKGNALWETSGGWIINQFQTPYDSTDVPLAQFTIADGASLHVQLLVYWDADPGDVVKNKIRWSNADQPFEREAPSCARSDIDGDGIVGLTDVLAIVGAWGDRNAGWQPIGHTGSIFSEIQGCSLELPPVLRERPVGTGSIKIVRSSELGGSSIDFTHEVEIAAPPGTSATTFTTNTNVSLLASTDCPVGTPARGWTELDSGYDFRIDLPTEFQWMGAGTTGVMHGLWRVNPDGSLGKLIAGDGTKQTGVLEPGRYSLRSVGDLEVGERTVSQDAMFESTLALLDPEGPGNGAAWRDIDGDGQVGIEDLLAVLGTWGPACPE
ncbi:MAG: hypothetical protein AB8G96_00965 [Phycisphaerales bacterium]